MLKNYLKIALRTLRRHPGYSSINILGLAIGIACCILILLYVQDELTFDAFHDQADRIVRVVEARESPDQGAQHFVYTMGPLGPTLEREVPEVVNSVRLVSRWSAGRRTVQHGENRFYEADYLFTEPSFFEVFDFELLRGDPETALNEPNTVVLTEAAATKYFGTEDPMGQTLQMEGLGDMTVTGLLKDPPKNSHLDFSMLFSYATIEAVDGWRRWMENWESTSFITYLVLDDGVSAETVEAKLPGLVQRHLDAEILAGRRPYLQPLSDVHFQSGHIDFDQNQGRADISTVYMFSAIALFIVLIACINYMNMATARSMQRAKEVGLRKTVGAQRTQLIGQFLGESVLTTFLALALALGIAWLTLPTFNAIADKELVLDLGTNAGIAFGLIILLLAVGIVSGSYPAFFLSKFRPATVLKGNVQIESGASRIRRGLVVTQFALSIAMIVATVVVYNQLQYIQTKRLGFNEEQLVVVDINDGNSRANFETIKREFMKSPAVRSVSVSSNVPGDWKNINQIDVAPADAPAGDLITTHFLGVDADFLETFEIDLIDGRAFSQKVGTDSLSVVLNQTAAARLGVSVGDRIRVPGESLWSQFEDTVFQPRVVGIVEDFHFKSLHQEIGPMVLGYWSNPIDVIDYFTARIDGQNIPETIAYLRSIGEQFDPRHPFEYNFLDERLQDFYEAERRVGRIVGMAAGLAILIACLGLFGLAAFTAERRTKEIGIRKVLGATVPSIMLLLSKDVLKLIAIAFVVAGPVAYLAMSRWLQDFAYRIELSWSIFLVAGLTALGVALLTVSYQSIRAALADPVESLRYE